MNVPVGESAKRPVFGRYVLRERLGRGGMAEVHLAEMMGPDGFVRLVALKRILPDLCHDEDFIRSFISEARLGGSLNHPNIVQTLDLGREGEQYFLAMEFVQGLTLSSFLRHRRERGELLPIATVLELARALSDGLAYAHDAVDAYGRALDLIHRDLKPGNVLLSRFGAVKIADFGIARSAASLRQTVAGGEVKGTVAYMSPEQARGNELDRRSDLYSLGAILFETLTLEPLYPSANGLAGLGRVGRGEIHDRLALLAPFPYSLVQIITRLLAAQRDARYASAADVKRDLAVFAAHYPTVPVDLGELVREALDAREARPSLLSAGMTTERAELSIGAASTASVELDGASGGSSASGGARVTPARAGLGGHRNLFSPWEQGWDRAQGGSSSPESGSPGSGGSSPGNGSSDPGRGSRGHGSSSPGSGSPGSGSSSPGSGSSSLGSGSLAGLELGTAGERGRRAAWSPDTGSEMDRSRQARGAWARRLAVLSLALIYAAGVWWWHQRNVARVPSDQAIHSERGHVATPIPDPSPPRSQETAQAVAAVSESPATPPPEPSPPPGDKKPPVEKQKRRSTRASAVGILKLSARPDARVSLDGAPLGYTPMQKQEVPAGEHLLDLRTEDGRSCGPIHVLMRANEPPKLVTVVFDELGGCSVNGERLQ